MRNIHPDVSSGEVTGEEPVSIGILHHDNNYVVTAYLYKGTVAADVTGHEWLKCLARSWDTGIR